MARSQRVDILRERAADALVEDARKAILTVAEAVGERFQRDRAAVVILKVGQHFFRRASLFRSVRKPHTPDQQADDYINITAHEIFVLFTAFPEREKHLQAVVYFAVRRSIPADGVRENFFRKNRRIERDKPLRNNQKNALRGAVLEIGMHRIAGGDQQLAGPGGNGPPADDGVNTASFYIGYLQSAVKMRKAADVLTFPEQRVMIIVTECFVDTLQHTITLSAIFDT